MTRASAVRVGWCPGALRPMPTGDGLVLRVKPRLGTLTLDQAGTLAVLAQSYGNGNLDLTGRANLQIRGVGTNTFDPLIGGLRTAGLLDLSPEAEAVRNVVASALTGVDPSAVCDIRPDVSALEAQLAADPDLHFLPAKWSIVVDQGGLFTLAGIAGDLHFEATPSGFNIRLAADPTRGFCEPDALAKAAVALCRQALDPVPSRMAEIVAARGAVAVFAAAGLPIRGDLVEVQRQTAPSDIIGPHRLADRIVLGIGAPFGALKAKDLSLLTELGRAAGATDVRLTPWRVLLLTGLNEASAKLIAGAAAERDLIVDHADPRLTVAACSGAPACPRATTPVRQHAELLARRLPEVPHGTAIHVSGCAKGCAHPGPSPWTLVGRDERYDLIRHGKAGDAAAVRGLTFQEAATWISRDGNPRRP